jgi:hypothetical protein
VVHARRYFDLRAGRFCRIFNFRLTAKALARYLPVSWLAPQEVRGYGVASFCILDLRGITVAPLTTQIGLTSISCAPRYAALDLSREQATLPWPD